MTRLRNETMRRLLARLVLVGAWVGVLGLAGSAAPAEWDDPEVALVAQAAVPPPGPTPGPPGRGDDGNGAPAPKRGPHAFSKAPPGPRPQGADAPRIGEGGDRPARRGPWGPPCHAWWDRGVRPGFQGGPMGPGPGRFAGYAPWGPPGRPARFSVGPPPWGVPPGAGPSPGAGIAQRYHREPWGRPPFGPPGPWPPFGQPGQARWGRFGAAGGLFPPGAAVPPGPPWSGAGWGRGFGPPPALMTPPLRPPGALGLQGAGPWSAPGPHTRPPGGPNLAPGWARPPWAPGQPDQRAWDDVSPGPGPKPKPPAPKSAPPKGPAA